MSMVQEVPRKLWRNSAGSIWGWIMERNDNRFVRQIPNALTIFRLATILTAILSYHSFYRGQMTAAWSWLITTGIIFGGTDYLDGKSARSLQVISTFGKFVDPVADKTGIITMLSLFAYSVGRSGYTSSNIIEWVITAVSCVVVVEGVLLVIAFVELSNRHVAGANRWGKDKVKVEIATTAVGSTLLFATFYGLPHWIAPIFVCLASIAIIIFGMLSFYGHVASLLVEADPTLKRP